MNWSDYVARVAPGAAQKDIAAAAGVDSSTVSRWKSGLAPKPENVVAFARAYERPVLEAFVAAGFLTPDEAEERPIGRPSLESFSVTELLSEVSRRTAAMEARQQTLDLFPDGEPAATKRPDAELKRQLASGNIPLPIDYYDLAAHPKTDSPSMRERAAGEQRGEESQDLDDDH